MGVVGRVGGAGSALVGVCAARAPKATATCPIKPRPNKDKPKCKPLRVRAKSQPALAAALLLSLQLPSSPVASQSYMCRSTSALPALPPLPRVINWLVQKLVCASWACEAVEVPQPPACAMPKHLQHLLLHQAPLQPAFLLPLWWWQGEVGGAAIGPSDCPL